ncbi:MAG: DUF402 domain-containing protein, partial [Anaerolineaceae bacterium]|nr:DUF402 domain-containing protein [Anaerolineaceae bacterium]
EAKAWYANLTRPATIAADSVSFIDLALDVLAFPAPGAMLVLDEDEYHALGLLPAEQAQVQSALKAVLPIMERLRTRTISLSDLFLETTL